MIHSSREQFYQESHKCTRYGGIMVLAIRRSHLDEFFSNAQRERNTCIRNYLWSDQSFIWLKKKWTLLQCQMAASSR